jgi:phosphoketolase
MESDSICDCHVLRHDGVERSGFQLVMDAIDRLPQTGDKGVYLKQQLKDKLNEHKQYINKHGQDMREIRNWRWKKDKHMTAAPKA